MDGYFAEPYSAFTLDKMHLAGLIVLGALGMLSVTALLPVIIFITMRLVAVPQVKHNQPIVLCFNLLLADLFQAMSFLASFHWVVEGGILAPSGWCHVQGALLNIGDLSSGFFVSFIALHTAWTIVRGRSLSHRIFTIIICCIWAVAVILTTIGPLKFGQKFFVRAGNWVSLDHQNIPQLRVADMNSSVGYHPLTKQSGSCSITCGLSSTSSVRSSSTHFSSYICIESSRACVKCDLTLMHPNPSVVLRDT